MELSADMQRKARRACCPFSRDSSSVSRGLLLGITLFTVAQAKDLRIGVFGLFHPSELVLRAAPGSALLIDIGGAEWTLDGSRTIRFRVGRSGILCTTRDQAASSAIVRVSGSHGEAKLILSVPGKIERRFVASLEIRMHAAELIPIVITDLETAVESAVAAESVQEAPLEALKAQAIAARSFYAASSARHRDFQFCDTTHCQFLREPPQEAGAAGAAAAATKAQILLHAGAPLAALFSSSCGGRTRTLAEAGMAEDGYPYYAVTCRPCQETAPDWQRSFPAEYNSLLEDRTEAHRIELGRVLGWNALPGPNYSLSREGGLIVVNGRGEGHGIGLCQRGANAMASSGADHRQILNYYYPNTVIGYRE
jgi:Stage II sporulation protein